MTELADVMLKLAASSQREFIMCAPFAKRAVVSEMLSVIPDGVEVTLYTRWRPEEVAAGVSDTEVLQVILDRGGHVYLHDRLHAKFYRNETHLLLGSANLTATALGWSTNPNIELLVKSDALEVVGVEQRLSNESIMATAELACEVDAIAKLLSASTLVGPRDAGEWFQPIDLWVPQLRIPSDLFGIHMNGLEALTSRSAAAAAVDLAVLDLPQGLNKQQFDALVGHRLCSQPLFRHIDEELKRPRRFGEVRRTIAELVNCDRNEADEIWQTVMRWMLEFLPHRYDYEVKRHSEIVSRRTTAKEFVE